jgi:hypothetical protein
VTSPRIDRYDNPDLVADSLASRDLTRVEIEGDHYGFPAETGREAAVAAMADWLER